MNAYQQKMIAEAKAKEEMENCTEEYVRMSRNACFNMFSSTGAFWRGA